MTTTNDEAFEMWWEDFQVLHDEWRFADREALLKAAYQAAKEEDNKERVAHMAFEAVYSDKVKEFVFIFPRGNRIEADGWTIDPEYIRKLHNLIQTSDFEPSWEGTELVLLALEKLQRESNSSSAPMHGQSKTEVNPVATERSHPETIWTSLPKPETMPRVPEPVAWQVTNHITNRAPIVFLSRHQKDVDEYTARPGEYTVVPLYTRTFPLTDADAMLKEREK